MSHPYAGSSASYPTNITQLDDLVDPRNAASVNTPDGQLADRTAWIASQLGGVLTRGASSGVQLLRHVATAAALTALTDLTSGEIACIDGVGLYQYKSTSTATVDGLVVVNGNGGSGRWLLLGAPLDANGKVPLVNTHEQLIERQVASDSNKTEPTLPLWGSTIDTIAAGGSGVWSGTYAATFASAVAVGDKIKFRGKVVISTSSGGTGKVWFGVTDGAGVIIAVAMTYAQLSGGQTLVLPLVGEYTVTTAMAANVCKVGIRAASVTAASQILQCSGFIADLVRP